MTAPQETPLLRFLRAASKAEKMRCAELAGTSVGYLYQLADPDHREPKIGLALRIVDAIRVVALERFKRGEHPALETLDITDLAHGRKAA